MAMTHKQKKQHVKVIKADESIIMITYLGGCVDDKV